jgi:single-stranded DNA-specific DHH superfamily exonuclease
MKNPKVYKIIAERAATAVLLNNIPEFDEIGLSEEEIELLEKEYNKICEQIRKRAVKIGGEFNRFSPFE